MNQSSVLFLVFNRPEPTEQVLNQIISYCPKRLYVAMDGPRQDNENDVSACAEVCRLIDTVPSHIKVQKLLREKNLGCERAVEDAITWFFEHEEMGIVLEDDCLPHPAFFEYANRMLQLYRDDARVMHIGGNNFQSENALRDSGYYFSKIPHIWGWATWRRAWENYDKDMSNYVPALKSGFWRRWDRDLDNCLYWVRCFENVCNERVNTWDYKWCFSILQNNGVCLSPNVNLVHNIGFSDEATHTTSGVCPPIAPSNFKFEEGELGLRDQLVIDHVRDQYTYRTLYGTKGRGRTLLRLTKKLKNRLRTLRIIRMHQLK